MLTVMANVGEGVRKLNKLSLVFTTRHLLMAGTDHTTIAALL